MRNRHSMRVALGAAALTVLFASSAFTASTDMGTVAGVVGHGSTVVSGATVLALDYTLDANGENVTAVDLQLEGDLSGSTAAIGFNGGATTACVTGAFDSVSSPTATAFTCTATTPTLGLVSTEVVVN